MRKLLSLMSVFALGATSVSGVVACQQESTVFHYKDAKAALESGNMVFEGDMKSIKETPKELEQTIQKGILIRLQTTRENDVNLTVEDFTVTIKSLDGKITYLDQGKIQVDSGYQEVINSGKELLWTVSSTDSKAKDDTVTFQNKLYIKEATNTSPADLLTWHDKTEKPAKIFLKSGKDVTNDNFPEVFFNANLGGPLEFNSFKDKFEVTLAPDGLKAIQEELTEKGKVVEVSLTFKVLKDFTTTQNLLKFTAGESATSVAFFTLG